jgi:hypothetical protein
MNGKLFLFSSAAVALSTYFSLTFFNPNLNDYQQSVLAVVANLEAERLASRDRRALEQEAANLTSQFLAVRYDPRRLDAAVIQKNHPLLGNAFSNPHEPSHGTLTERLSFFKEQALKRIETTRETMRHGWLVDLTRHTKRNSYGAWSHFSTCLKDRTLSYIGIAGRFYERTEHDCSTADPS